MTAFVYLRCPIPQDTTDNVYTHVRVLDVLGHRSPQLVMRQYYMVNISCIRDYVQGRLTYKMSHAPGQTY